MLDVGCLIKLSPLRGIKVRRTLVSEDSRESSRLTEESSRLYGGVELLAILAIIFLSSCGPNTLWTFDHDIILEEEDISPNGITIIGDQMWIADTDNNRLVRIDNTGTVIEEIEGLERPMHINQVNQMPLIPEYGSDLIRVLNQGVLDTIAITAEPDAAASADIYGDRIIVADFYNHRVIYEIDGVEHHIGKKGDADGEFHYPTDVQFLGDQIFVADAYNHRVQVFDLDGKHVKTIAADAGMNAATGIYVNADYIVVTDFENDRVLTYSHDGEQLDVMAEGFHRPTDALIHEGQLYVLNFKGKFISVFQ